MLKQKSKKQVLTKGDLFMNILEKIKTTKTRLGKSEMTFGDKFKIKITYNGKSCDMTFHDNFENKSDKNDFIYSMLLDADVNLADFMANYGYENEKKAKAIYNACRIQARKVNKLFTEEEQEELQGLLADY